MSVFPFQTIKTVQAKETAKEIMYTSPLATRMTCENDHVHTLSQTNSNYNLTNNSDFKSKYFANLTQNFGVNYKASCGYVAIGMLLSYYDTYLSDTIIPESYDVISNGESSNITTRGNSPGILKDEIVNAPEMNSYEYFAAISSIDNVSLHAKLITMGAEMGYYFFSDQDPCKTSFEIILNVLNHYLSSFIGLTQSEYTINTMTGSSSVVKNYTISQINQGNPVLLGIIYGGTGHIVIAYDYDSELNKLYGHMGWDQSMTHISLDNYPCVFALTLDFNIEHTHSNNYAVTKTINDTTTTHYYCYHEENIAMLDHKIERYVKYSNEKHKAICSCGYYELRPHAIKHGSSYVINGRKYANCINCGARVDLGKAIVIGDGQLTLRPIISANGSYVLPNGMLIIVEEDLQDYINGTLQLDINGDERS